MMKNRMGAVLLCIGILISSSAAASAAQGTGDVADQASFTIVRIVFAESVEEREPVGIAENFPASLEKVFCFLEAADISRDTAVTFVWFYEDREMHAFELPLTAGPRWRVYAYKNLRGMSGQWSVEIRDAGGNAVKSASFTVEQ